MSIKFLRDFDISVKLRNNIFRMIIENKFFDIKMQEDAGTLQNQYIQRTENNRKIM